MNASGEALAAAAESLQGIRFRLHGRDPATGLDCIGLVGASLALCGRQVRFPQGYRLRNRSIDAWLVFSKANALHPATGTFERGDILLTRPGPAQHHLLVALGESRFVHAHAGLRRVVAQHFAPSPSTLAHWRLSPEPEAVWQP